MGRLLLWLQGRKPGLSRTGNTEGLLRTHRRNLLLFYGKTELGIKELQGNCKGALLFELQRAQRSFSLPV